MLLSPLANATLHGFNFLMSGPQFCIQGTIKPHGVSAKMYRHTQISGLISQADLNKIASMFQSQPTAKQLGGFSVGQRGQMDSVTPLTLGKDPSGFVYHGHSFLVSSLKSQF